jgi:hypothetical protein
MTAAYYFRDPGAANVISALHEARVSRDTRIASIIAATGRAPELDDFVVWAKGAGREVWVQHGHPEPSPLPPALARDSGEDTLGRLFVEAGIDIVLTGVSDADDDTAPRLWRAARAAGIPSIAALDDHDNIAARFATRDGARCAPDIVLAIDAAMERAVAALGFEYARTEIVGDLHAERMARRGLASADECAALRRKWGVDDDSLVVLFASSCIVEMSDARDSDVDELLALERLDENLSEGWRPAPLRARKARELVLVVRPHPRDGDNKYDGWCRNARSRFVVSRAGDARHAISAVDFVTGTSPAMLREAEALGVPCLSVAPWGIAGRPVELELPLGARQLEFPQPADATKP